MPLYEYRCLQCGKVTEVLVPLSKEGSPSCSFCGSGDTEKKYSVPGVLRGSRKEPRTDGTCCGASRRCDHPRCERTGDCPRD